VALHLQPDSGAFTIDAAATIQLGAKADAPALFAGRRLQEAVRDATGLTLALHKGVLPAGRRRISLHLSGSASGHQTGSVAANETGDTTESYTLDVRVDRVEITAPGDAGLFYGVQTLRQLLRFYGAQIPALTIQDRPVLAHRGLMLDVSRGKVPTLDTLFALVDGLAAFKYNQLQLYVEHTFAFPSHPAIGAGADPLTADDMLALDAFCRQRHVELVPNLQSFGHQRQALSLPMYSALDEVGWRWSLSPAREETYRLLDDLYGDLLPAFQSSWLNVDCDETWDLATGQSKARAAEIGKGRVYLEHILRLRQLAAKYGRRIMVWADVLHHYPELVAELPEDVLLLDWEYQDAEHYPTTVALGQSGRTFWVCPGTSSWNTLFPRTDNALGNIRTYVRDGLQSGASGMLLTDWGDYGHYLSLTLSWYAYLFGAATAWTGAQTTAEDFDDAFAPVYFQRPEGDPAVSSLRRLGRAVTAPTLGMRNRSLLTLSLFEDPLTGDVSVSADPEVLTEVQSAAHDAIAAWASLPDPALRREYGFAARMVALAASKALYTQSIRQLLRDLSHRSSIDALARLDASLVDLRSGQQALAALRMEFEQVWLRQARRSEIQRTLTHFEAADRHYVNAVSWLETQRVHLAEGHPVDVDLRTYVAQPFVALWEQGMIELRNLATLVGIEELPEDIRSWLGESTS
jgi:hypothetical protein